MYVYSIGKGAKNQNQNIELKNNPLPIIVTNVSHYYLQKTVSVAGVEFTVSGNANVFFAEQKYCPSSENEDLKKWISL